MLPSLTAARRMHLRRRARQAAVAAGGPVAVLVATCAYRLGVGMWGTGADAVTAGLGYVFGAVLALSLLVGAQTLRELRTRYRLDTTLPAYGHARWCAIAALVFGAVWVLLGSRLVPFFFGGQ